MGAEPQAANTPLGDQDETIPSAGSLPFERGSTLQAGCVLEKRFVIQKLLGAGGMGEVYEAEDLRLNRARVALKTMRSEYASEESALQRFQHEVLLSRSIAHPNVCPVFEMFSTTGSNGGEMWFLTMKLLSGETLASRLANKRMELGEGLRICREIAAGLQAIHELGIVHRDLKPGNVFLETLGVSERAVVTDFGLARICSEPQSLTDVGHVVGTPSYIAPEVRAGGTATPRSDIYSFGILVHELLFGARPDAATTLSLMKTAETGSMRRLRAVVTRCLALDPGQRFASAAEVASALDQAVEDSPLLSRRAALTATALAATAGVFAIWAERDEISLILHPVPKPRRVAVLPAVAHSESAQDASLLDGVLESIRGQLARSEKFEPDLVVVPSRYLQRQNIANIAQVLGLFGANLLLSGALQHEADSVTLNLRLTQSSGKLLRHGAVSTPFADLYTLASLAGRRAATLLDIRRDHWNPQPATGDTTNPEAYAAYERGRGLLRGYGLPVTDQAIAELQKAVALDPRFARAWASLADAYSTRFHLTQDSAALDLADRNSGKALELAPELSAAYSSRARVELYRGLYDAAVKDAQKASLLDPDNADAQISLAETYLQSGKLDLVEQTYRNLSQEKPNDWLVLNDWGDFCMDQANYSRAEKLLREATLLAPQAALPWRNLGAVYLATGQLSEADRVLNRSIALLPTGEAYTNLGTALFWQGEYRRAAEAYRQAVNLNPQRPLLWRNLGDAYQMIGGMNDKAKAAWGKAADLTAGLLDVNPNNLDALVSLALYRAKLGQSAAAFALLRRADTLHGRTVEQLFYEVQAYELAGNREGALRLLKDCIRLGYSPADILHAPELANLRKDPRFRALGLNAAAK